MPKLSPQSRTKLFRVAVLVLVVIIAGAVWIGTFYPNQADLNVRLEAAVFQNDLDGVQRLIARGADIDGRVQIAGYDLVDQGSRSPLIDAIEYGQDEMARLLIDSGAQLYFDPPEYYVSAVRWALYYCNGTIAEYIVYEVPRYDPDREDVNELLLLSAECGYVELTEFWIEEGADPRGAANKTGDLRGTPLNRAVKENHVAVAEVLVEHGVNLNAEGPGYPYGTPLAVASAHAAPQTIQRLVALGAHPNQMSEGKTPLHWALEADKAENVIALLESGADPTLPDAGGETAYALAERLEKPDLMRVLGDATSPGR